jgi:hypothetical protein
MKQQELEMQLEEYWEDFHHHPLRHIVLKAWISNADWSSRTMVMLTHLATPQVLDLMLSQSLDGKGDLVAQKHAWWCLYAPPPAAAAAIELVIPI